MITVKERKTKIFLEKSGLSEYKEYIIDLEIDDYIIVGYFLPFNGGYSISNAPVMNFPFRRDRLLNYTYYDIKECELNDIPEKCFKDIIERLFWMSRK